MKPTPEQTRPAEIDGYVFYQGQDGSAEADKQHTDADLVQLAKLTQDAGAEAFTTCGKVILCLQPQQAWRHSSFKPSQGMYVKQAALQYRQLQEPAPASDLADAFWPPQVHGWVYFPSCASPGHHKLEPSDTLARYQTLEAALRAAAQRYNVVAVTTEVREAAVSSCNGSSWPGVLARYQTLEAALRAAAQRYNVVAVTTEGEMKTKLRPQACWEVHPCYDVGLYVRAPHVQQLGLVPSPAVPDYRRLCSRLQQLRLDAAHMSCAWLNDQYFSLQAIRDSPADSGMALVLHSVWWLDIKGSIPGVPPGCYEVAWVADVTNSYLDNVAITLSAEAVPVHAKQQQQQQADEAAAAGASSAASSSAAAAAAAASEAAGAEGNQRNKVEVQQRWDPDLRRLQQLCRGQGTAWGVVSGGVLHVTDYSTVQLGFSATDNTYKQNMRWAMVELIPVDPQQQQQQQQQAAAQRNRVWQQPARQACRMQGERRGAAAGSSGAAQHGYGQGLMSWLESMFGRRFE
uniref:Uncharacterized protein n=1 Tax=Tetradesmus obliquus TaxID=3088 RepID=A0A383VJN0_TETOB|eukprot:jgi/Sobl393_1/14125/SZX65747.1